VNGWRHIFWEKTVVACVIVPGSTGQPTKQIRTFGTMTADLEALAAWLRDQAVTHVAMEATGVYWQPLYNVLEDEFTLLLANARHIKMVPGRKTDVKDCEWIADLLRHGLLRGSFVPERAQREVRELTRYRTALLHERSSEVNRLHKTQVEANLQLAAVATDILGLSGRQILDALVAGSTAPALLAELAHGRLRDKRPALERALAGRVRPHHRFLLAQQLAHIDDLDAVIAQVSTEIETRLRPFAATLERLDTIPGISQRAAEILLAELGPDLTAFPSAAHLASWAGLCPGNHQSAGERLSGRPRPGNPALRALLVQAAHAAGRTQTHLGARYRRLAHRKGRKRAAVAVAHTLLRIVYALLTQHTVYQDLGVHYFDQQHRQAIERRAIRRLESPGYTVTLAPTQPAA